MSTQEDVSVGLADSDRVPNVSVRLSDGSSVDLPSLAGDAGLVVAFVRSLDWCPFCKKQVRGLSDISGNLAASGWTLAALSYDPPDVMAHFAEKNGIGFPLLSDEGSAVINAFNLRNTKVKPGGRSVGVPHPAIVFIGSDGTIKATLRESGYRSRPTSAEVLETVAKLKAN